MQYILEALSIVCQPANLFTLIISTGAGLMMGVLPGLSTTMAVALLTGLTYSFSHEAALISLLGVYVGAVSGGCQSAILLNIPGTPASASTALDGFPIAKSGRGGLAIFVATTASCIGTLVSVVFVLTLTPLLTAISLMFTSWEFFLLSIFGILICGAITGQGKAIKGWISGILGLLVACVGYDRINMFPRFSYNNVNFMGGLQLIPIMIGLFGFPEIVRGFKIEEDATVLTLTKFKMKEGWTIIRQNLVAILRSSVIGVGVGVIPGVGEDVGGWLSYWASKTFTKNPEPKFGEGNIKGVASAEAGNNACIGGAIIPVLSLAVPGSAPAAVLLAALLMHGYRPGPLLLRDFPDVVYKIGVYLVFASVAMWLLAQVMSKVSVRILRINKKILMPIIYCLCVVGSYLINFNRFDIKTMFFFGLLGLFLTWADVPLAPFLLGVILGPMLDENVRRGLDLSKGSFAPMFHRPICIFFFVVIIFMILSQLGVFRMISAMKNKKKENA